MSDSKEIKKKEEGKIQPFDKEDVDEKFVKRYFKQNLASMPGECGSCYKRCPDCPYEDEFEDLDMRNENQICKDEVSQLAIKFQAYRDKFNIPKDDVFGLSQLRRLLNIELKLYRLELADDGDFWDEEIAAITLEGDTITEKKISEKEEYQERLEERRRKEIDALMDMYEPSKDVSQMTYGEIADISEASIERKDDSNNK